MADMILEPEATPVTGYRADLWQIVTDAKGFESIHETDEDGNPGDLVAHVFGNNAELIAAAPGLAKAAEAAEHQAWHAGYEAGATEQAAFSAGYAKAERDIMDWLRGKSLRAYSAAVHDIEHARHRHG